jgi:hypothetical protein
MFIDSAAPGPPGRGHPFNGHGLPLSASKSGDTDTMTRRPGVEPGFSFGPQEPQSDLSEPCRVIQS